MIDIVVVGGGGDIFGWFGFALPSRRRKFARQQARIQLSSWPQTSDSVVQAQKIQGGTQAIKFQQVI